jgi:heme-degrading monooxygenase HmoA
MSVRVVLSTTVEDGEQEAFELAYQQMAKKMQGTPGHVCEELLYDAELRRYTVYAEWTSRKDFLAWVQNPAHVDWASPIVPYLERNFERRMLDVVARTDQNGTTRAA